MTTSENPTGAGRPSLTGLAVLNLAMALIIVLAQSTTLTVLAYANEADEGLGKTTLVFPFIVIILAMAAATISIWHSSIAESRDTLFKGIGLTAWILTFVTQGFGAISVILMLVSVFRL